MRQAKIPIGKETRNSTLPRRHVRGRLTCPMGLVPLSEKVIEKYGERCTSGAMSLSPWIGEERKPVGVTGLLCVWRIHPEPSIIKSQMLVIFFNIPNCYIFNWALNTRVPQPQSSMKSIFLHPFGFVLLLRLFFGGKG